MSANHKSPEFAAVAEAELRITGQRHCPHCYLMRPANDFSPKKRGKPWCCNRCFKIRYQRGAK